VDVRAQYEPTGDWTFRALLDTGAPVSVFDRGVADALGVRIGRTGAETGTIRMLGGEWRVQYETVDLDIGDGYGWPARVAFVKSPNLQMPFQGVLGSEGFFRRFAVTFNEYYGYFTIDTPDGVTR
jgi:hypothetical protein